MKKAFEPVGGVVVDAASPVSSPLKVLGSCLIVCKVRSSCIEVADLVFLSKHIQELRGVSDELLLRRAGEMTVQMDTLLKLYSEENILSELELELKKLIILLAEIPIEQKFVFLLSRLRRMS